MSAFHARAFPQAVWLPSALVMLGSVVVVAAAVVVAVVMIVFVMMLVTVMVLVLVMMAMMAMAMMLGSVMAAVLSFHRLSWRPHRTKQCPRCWPVSSMPLRACAVCRATLCLSVACVLPPSPPTLGRRVWLRHSKTHELNRRSWVRLKRRHVGRVHRVDRLFSAATHWAPDWRGGGTSRETARPARTKELRCAHAANYVARVAHMLHIV